MTEQSTWPSQGDTLARDRDNRMVWDRTTGGRFEAWEAIVHHPLSQSGFTIRHALCAPIGGQPVARLVVDHCDAKHPERNRSYCRQMSIDELVHRSQPFSLRIGSAELTSARLRGSLGDGALIEAATSSLDRPLEVPDIEWDLQMSASSFTHRQLPELAYRRGITDLHVLSPNPTSQFTGTLRIGASVFEFDEDSGSQIHRWGSRHAHAWAWGRCHTFREDPTAYLDVLSLRVRRGPLVSPPLTLLSLYLGREVYHFKDLWGTSRAHGQWETGLYRFGATGAKIKIEGDLRSRPEDLVRTELFGPRGQPMFTHATSVADATVRVHHRRSRLGKFRQVLKLTSRAGACLEYASRSPDGSIERTTVGAVEPPPVNAR